MRIFAFAFIASLALISCSEKATSTYEIKGVSLTAEGPLFDGPNTLQANHIVQLSTDLKPDQIVSVKLTKGTIHTADSNHFNSIRNFVFQLTSNNAKMQKAGVVNPVPKDQSSVNLIPASEAELTDLFKEKEITLILDADLEGDRDESLTYTGDFEFEITYKK